MSDAVQRAQEQAKAMERKAKEAARQARLKEQRQEQRVRDALELSETMARKMGLRQGSAAIDLSGLMLSGRARHVVVAEVPPSWTPPAGYEPVAHAPGGQVMLHDAAKYDALPRGARKVGTLARHFKEGHRRKCQVRNRVLDRHKVDELPMADGAVITREPSVPATYKQLAPEEKLECTIGLMESYLEQVLPEEPARRRFLRRAEKGDMEGLEKLGIVAKQVASPNVDTFGQSTETLDVQFHKWTPDNPYPKREEGDKSTAGTRVVTGRRLFEWAQRMAERDYDGWTEAGLVHSDPLGLNQPKEEGEPPRVLRRLGQLSSTPLAGSSLF